MNLFATAQAEKIFLSFLRRQDPSDAHEASHWVPAYAGTTAFDVSIKCSIPQGDSDLLPAIIVHSHSAIEISITDDSVSDGVRHSRERGNPLERWLTWIPAFAGMTHSDLNAVVSYGNPNKRDKTGDKSLVGRNDGKVFSVFSVVKIVFAFSITPAAAQGLPDPTRPPQFVAPTATAAEALSPQLHSVVVPAHGKPMAMVGGVPVSVGDKVGDAKVVRISETEVVLRGPEGEQVLRMTPGVDKQVIAEPQVGQRSEKSRVKKSAKQKPSDESQEQRKEKSTP